MTIHSGAKRSGTGDLARDRRFVSDRSGQICLCTGPGTQEYPMNGLEYSVAALSSIRDNTNRSRPISVATGRQPERPWRYRSGWWRRRSNWRIAIVPRDWHQKPTRSPSRSCHLAPTGHCTPSAFRLRVSLAGETLGCLFGTTDRCLKSARRWNGNGNRDEDHDISLRRDPSRNSGQDIVEVYPWHITPERDVCSVLIATISRIYHWWGGFVEIISGQLIPTRSGQMTEVPVVVLNE